MSLKWNFWVKKDASLTNTEGGQIAFQADCTSFNFQEKCEESSFFFSHPCQYFSLKILVLGIPDGSVVKNPPANAGDTRSKSGLGRSHMPQSN